MDSIWGLIIGALGLVLTSTVITAYVSSRVGLKKLPMEERTSKADAAESITNSAIALSASWEQRFKEVLEDLKEVKGKVTVLEDHSEKQDKEITSLRKHIERWVDWYQGIQIDWPVIRLRETAPNPPDTQE